MTARGTQEVAQELGYRYLFYKGKRMNARTVSSRFKENHITAMIWFLVAIMALTNTVGGIDTSMVVDIY
jgi:hypothetical protein